MPALADSYLLLRPSISTEEPVTSSDMMTALPSPGTAASGTSGSLPGPNQSASQLHVQAIPGFHPSNSPRTSSPLPVSSGSNNNNNNKRRRRPAGTPDPDAEVVALSPQTLMESDRYVCEICNQGFQRDQNLQMHRRRHKVPWKLLKRATPEVRKRVYVCPDPTCLHNDPCHALGDLVGIKKHFRRKHSVDKQWKCEKCSKGYAVQSDYKAHLKTCGTRGHSCDCGRVFSRVESFIEHQDSCSAAKERATFGSYNSTDQAASLPCLTVRTSSSGADTLSAPRSGLSTAGRPFDSANYKLEFEKPWLREPQQSIISTELQLLPSKQKPGSLCEAAAPNSTLIRDIGASFVTNPGWNPPSSSRAMEATGFLHSSHSDETESSAPTLQLSIGLCTRESSDKKSSLSLASQRLQRQPSNAASATTPGGTPPALGLTLSSNSFDVGHTNKEPENIDHRAAMNYTDLLDSSKPAEYHEPSGSAVSENEFRAADDRANLKRKEPPDFLEALWRPGHMRKREPEADRDEGILVERPAVSLLWKSARQLCPERYTDNMAANNNNSGRLNQGVERTELVNAWSDIAAARLAKEQALQERNEAQSDMAGAELLKRQAREQLRHASAEKAYAEHARDLAKRQIELAEAEFASAKRIQEQAHAQLAKARLLKEQATRRIDATRLEITCQACRRQFQCQVPSSPSTASWGDQYDNSNPNLLVMSHNFQRGSGAADQNQNNILKKEA